MRINTLTIICLLNLASCHAQTAIDNYVGGWAGTFEEKDPFQFDIRIVPSGERIVASFTGHESTSEIPLDVEDSKYLVGKIADQLTIRIDTASTPPIAFVQTGHHLSNIELNLTASGVWAGEWNLLIEGPFLPSMYLSLDKLDDGGYGASTFFKEPTYHYMWGQDFRYSKNDFEFRDIRSDIKFTGVLKDEQIDLTLHFLDESAKIELSPLPYDQWQIGQSSEIAAEESPLPSSPNW